MRITSNFLRLFRITQKLSQQKWKKERYEKFYTFWPNPTAIESKWAQKSAGKANQITNNEKKTLRTAVHCKANIHRVVVVFSSAVYCNRLCTQMQIQNTFTAFILPRAPYILFVGVFFAFPSFCATAWGCTLLLRVSFAFFQKIKANVKCLMFSHPFVFTWIWILLLCFLCVQI